MITKENVSLKRFNTFGLEALAKYYVQFTTEESIIDFLQNHEWAKMKLLPLGGGSNLLLTKDYEGVVLKVDLKGISLLENNKNETLVKVSAGETWHDFVLWAIKENLGGLENLSLIPGNVGTAPIQNIGAYGVELKDHFVSLECIEIETGIKKTFTKEECEFGYRDSIFKRHAKGKYIITQVIFSLTNRNHLLRTDYGAIQNQLRANNVTTPSIKDVSDAVIAIRESKLPDPKKIGNSGSFFKNPVIKNEDFERLKEVYPDISAYPNIEGYTKVAAGWLIEKAGWKGYREGDFGVHKNQALVLVNYGNAQGKDLKELSSRIQKDIKEKFGIYLEAEVNIL